MGHRRGGHCPGRDQAGTGALGTQGQPIATWHTPAQSQNSAQPLMPVRGVPSGSLLCPLRAALLAGRVQNLLPQGVVGGEKPSPCWRFEVHEVHEDSRLHGPLQKAHTSRRVHLTGGETEAPGRVAEWPRRSGLRVSARRRLGRPVLLRAALRAPLRGAGPGPGHPKLYRTGPQCAACAAAHV